MDPKATSDSLKLLFAERIKRRRQALGITQQQLRDRIDSALHAKDYMSRETLRDMEGGGSKLYRLPSRLSGKGLSPVEAVALGLSVPLGYLLGGFSEAELRTSCFWERIGSGKIVLLNDLLALEARGGFADFVAGLPNTEDELFKLPLHTYKNERAFAAIFRIERLYSGLEMVVVNEPPLIFWDDEDVDAWINNMELNEADTGAFRFEFQQYRDHFRQLAQDRKKSYRVVLNRATFSQWLKRKPKAKRQEQLALMEQFAKLPNFELVFLRPAEHGRHRTNAMPEKEVLSKHRTVPELLEDTIAIQISQTPPDHRPVEYCLTPLHSHGYLLQEEKSHIDLARAKAIEQAEEELHRNPIKDADVSAAALQILNKISREVDAM